MQELTNKLVKVKKPRRCVWCGEAIPVGGQARYRAYVFDGFQTDYMHPECYEAMADSDWRAIDPLGDGWTEGMYQRGKRAEDCEV